MTNKEMLLAAPVEDVCAVVDAPVGYADPKAFENFKTGIATHEWMWAFADNGLIPLYRHPQRRIEMADVVKAHMGVPYCPVLTSNQCHAIAVKLNEVLNK